MELRRKAANLGLGERASARVLLAESTARDVYMAMGIDEFWSPDALGRSLQKLRDFLAPGALNAAYRDGVRFFAFYKNYAVNGRALGQDRPFEV